MGNEAASERVPPFVPKPSTLLHVSLSITALIGWMIFILACVGGPAWSPDGSKIIFGYYDEQNSRVDLALYDVSKHKARDIFSAPASDKNDKGILGLVPVWQVDGSRALVGITAETPDSGDAHCSLVSIPVKSEIPLQVYSLGKSAVCWSASLIVQLGDTVYLSGDDGLVLLNLTTGNLESKGIPGGAQYIAEHNGKLVYIRSISRPAPTAENKDATEDGVEVGEVDLKEVTLRPFYSLWKADFADIDALRDALGGSWEPGGTRVAMVAEGDDSDTLVLLDEKKKIISSFVPEVGAHKFHLGTPVWSLDGKLLYVPVIISEDKKDEYTYSLGEIPVGGGSVRLTRITAFEWEKSDDLAATLALGLQVSLSPNGRTIAASTASLGKGVVAADRALFLIDLRRSDRRITRISPPKKSKSQ